MAFSTNYTVGDSIIPEGNYECVVSSAYVSATQGGSLYFSVRLIVRNDVPQSYQNKNIFHSIWQKSPEKQTEDDAKVDGYSYKQLMNLAEMAGIPKGKGYETLDELGKDLEGKCVMAAVGHSEWKGKVSAKVKWFNRTKYPECKHTFKSPDQTQTAVSTANSSIDVPDDDDLPFD